MKTAPNRTEALAIAAVCLLGGVWSMGAAQAAAAGPMLSLRADQMVLDAAAHGPKLRGATQSGQVGAFDWREVYRRQLDYGPIHALAVGPERRRAAMALRSSDVQFVAAESGKSMHVPQRHRDSISDLVWLGPDRLASAGKDKSLLLWDISRTGPVQALLFADPGRRLVSAGDDARVLAWNVDAGSPTSEPQRSKP